MLSPNLTNKDNRGNTTSRGIRVMIVDDHKLIRKGLIEILKAAGGIQIVGEADSGEEALRLIRETEVDVLVMDLQMPGMGGLEATRKLLRLHPDMKILILTVCESDVFPMKLLETGVAGYVTKDCSPDEMLRAIRAVHLGQRYVSPNIAQALALKKYGGKEGDPFQELSERELQILVMMIKGQSIQSIADTLHLSPKTVNTYRYRLFAKLNVKSDVELTFLAIRHGLIQESDIQF